MRLKKIIGAGVIIAGIFGMSFVMADMEPYQQMPQVVEHPMSLWSYVEAQFGYSFQDYEHSAQWTHGTNSGVSDNNNNTQGGLIGGVDLGLSINNHYGVELGWVYLPDVNVAGTDTGGNQLPAVYLTSWVTYLAAKYRAMVPWLQHTDWFVKAGVAYRYASVSTTAIVNQTYSLPITSGSSSYVRPMFGTGFDWALSNMWNLVFQYEYFMGNNDSFPLTAGGSLGTEDDNIIGVGIMYKFMF